MLRKKKRVVPFSTGEKKIRLPQISSPPSPHFKVFGEIRCNDEAREVKLIELAILPGEMVITGEPFVFLINKSQL